MRNKGVALIVVILFASLSYAQNKISLLDTEEVNKYLEFTQEQIRIINPKIEQIKKILEDDRKIISTIKERIKNDDEPGFFEKIRVKNGRDRRINQINDLLEDIVNKLNDEQKGKYKSIKKPELKTLSKKELSE